MTLLDIFRAVVALAAPAWCPPSLAAASHEFARHRRDWVEGQAVRSLVAAVPALGRDLGQRRVMANGQLVGRPGHNFADAAGTERVPQSGHSRTGSCVHTRSVGFAFLVPRSGPVVLDGDHSPHRRRHHGVDDL